MQFRAPHYDSLPVHIFLHQNPQDSLSPNSKPRNDVRLYALSTMTALERSLALEA